MTFDAAGDLWLLRHDGRLFSVDPVSGSATQVYDAGRQLSGLAACGDRLFALEQSLTPSGGRLVELDPATGSVIPRGPLHEDLDGQGIGLDFDAAGRLWTVLDFVPIFPVPGFPEDKVVEVDPATGAPRSVLPTEFGGEGLALGPPPAVCPAFGQPALVPTLSPGGLIAAVAIFLLLGWWMLLRLRPMG